MLNKFGVGYGVGDDSIALLMPRQRMTKQEALELAAWLVALADPTQEKFEPILQQVLGT